MSNTTGSPQPVWAILALALCAIGALLILLVPSSSLLVDLVYQAF